jgi:hypothetical protein
VADSDYSRNIPVGLLQAVFYARGEEKIKGATFLAKRDSALLGEGCKQVPLQVVCL